MKSSPLVVWRLLDGTVGHQKQTQACVEALAAVRDLECVDIPVTTGALTYLLRWVAGRSLFPDAKTPDLILGAGHRTHLPLLLAKRQQSAPAVVVMTPSLPRRWFDVIIAPEHDYHDKTVPDNVITTLTALAPVVESYPDASKGLILLGGVSKHFDWIDRQVIDAVRQLVNAYGCDVQWQLSTSRRTPAPLLNELKDLCADLGNLQVFDYRELSAGWLAAELKTAGKVWVTSDSASMLAEALQTQADVGLLQLSPKGRQQKFNRTHQKLMDLGVVKSQQNLTHGEQKKRGQGDGGHSASN